ncbi:NADPH2:quinone reductase [Streptomyces sp. DvalAA-14]|uniref:quinone oxidoreductase family protein n=1 Tax=unclassified Streptomyces TaxID=2593676 RepID=UPI00081B3C91|nr:MULTISPECIES: zinc-binding dehydrogenase [unclassified Streptomyces]MYS20243.1 zinc-binding dehydrogenase [Streptomyces sp. SID4948]SCD64340.1 NADPH2:quinone reductase [Streptomyces sp. DvalAA-14]
MRAIRIDAFGGPEVLTPVELPDPVAGPGEVLIRIAAAGVNRADALTRAGTYHRAGKPPLIPGLEASGTVVAVGEGVADITAGQRVMAQGAANSPGFYAELAAVPAERVTALPDGVDLASAAGLPIAWLSAWYCLHRLGGLAAGRTVVVQAAASGVGSAAVQIAAAAGARVIAVAGSPAKTAWVAGFGAHHTVDSSAFPGDAAVDEVLRLTGGAGADLVLDTVGGDVFAHSLRQTAFAGRVVALSNVALRPSTVDTRDFYPKNVSIHGFQLTGLIEHGYDPRPDLRTVAEAVADGTFRIPIESAFPLHEASRAHRRLEDRANLGKIILTVQE